MLTWWLNSLSEIEDKLLPCPFKWLTGCDCPTCGMQRSILHLLRGDVEQSWTTNPGGVTMCILAIIYVFTHTIEEKLRRFLRGFLLYTFLLILILHWLFKIYSNTCCY